MKNKLIVILGSLIAAGLLSALVSTWYSAGNVSACVQAPGCVQQGEQPIGTLTVRNYGFPATYKQSTSFSPVNGDSQSADYAGYAIASAETRPFNGLLLIINVVFWLSLFYALYSLYTRIRPAKVKSTPAEPAEPPETSEHIVN